MIAGCPSPKLPKRFNKISIKRNYCKLVQKSSRYIRFIEKFLRPRLIFMTSQVAERIIGVFIFIFCFVRFIAYAAFKFHSWTWSFGNFFGLLGKDGLVVIAGVFIGLIGVFISLVVIFPDLKRFILLKIFSDIS